MDDLYLQHSGILNQRWGVRNGPPYPLKPSQYSAAEKRAMKKEQKASVKAAKKERKDSLNKSLKTYEKDSKKKGKTVKIRYKNTREMTDEELDAANKRLRAENEYNRYISDRQKAAKKPD